MCAGVCKNISTFVLFVLGRVYFIIIIKDGHGYLHYYHVMRERIRWVKK